MRTIRSHVALALVAPMLLCAAHAPAQTINLCQSKKKVCVAKKEAALLKCHSTAEKKGVTVDPACTQKAQDKFDGGADPTKGCFARLEAKGGCLTTNDSSSLESTVDSFVANAVTQVDPGFPTPVTSLCSSAKKKCIANKAKALLKCHAKAEKTGTLDPTCVQKAQTKFADPVKGCFAKAETKGDCLTTGDTAALENTVDSFVLSVVCALDSTEPGCGACPTTWAFKATGPNADVDQGWTGQWHDSAVTTNFSFGGTISACANASQPCGSCTLSGPIASPIAGVQYRRCLGDNTGGNGSNLTCNTNADCPGAGNACVTYLGPPQPQAIGGVSLCTMYDLEGPFSGTIDVGSGAVSIPVTMRARIYIGATLSDPCPMCVGGTCNGGARSGFACTTTGHSQLFADDVSLDCPPPGTGLSPDLVESFAFSTGSQTLTVDATSPKCTALGFTSDNCQCSTCNNLAGTTCHVDADCTAVGATKCGGKRCINGTNAGTPCTNTSECPGGACSVLGGAQTAPNQCDDGVCTPNPSDTDSVNEGTCAGGPLEKFCTIETFRGCAVNSDCPAPGDSCNPVPKARECFTDNGVVGASDSVGGTASTMAPTLGAIGCMPPTSASALNLAAGLPGVMRFTLPGTATLSY